MHNAAESRCSTKESVGPWGDAWYVRFASGEEFRMRKRFVKSLNQDTNHPPERGANCHGWYEYACRDLAAIGDDDKKSSHDSGK